MNYWLIEHYDYPSGHRWLRIWVTGSVNGIDKAELTWTTEPSLALQFARQQDAEMFALMHHEWCVLARITSHMDLDTSGVKEVGEAQRLVADLEHRARYWRQPGIGKLFPLDAVHDFAEELDRAVAALRAAGVALPDGGRDAER